MGTTARLLAWVSSFGKALHFELDHVGAAMLDAHVEGEGRIGPHLLTA